MYSFGMSDRDIRAHLEKRYNMEVPPPFGGAEWQRRLLEKSYAIVHLDALRIKGREDVESCMKNVYITLAVNFERKKEVFLSPKVQNFRWAC
jgi:transposase-like protein